VLAQSLEEFRQISEYEQLVILHVPHIVNAYAARRALTQVGDLSASVRPLLRIERAVIDRADRIGERLGGDALQTDHVERSLSERCRMWAEASRFDESQGTMTADGDSKTSLGSRQFGEDRGHAMRAMRMPGCAASDVDC
jgi:hypothetical protein